MSKTQYSELGRYVIEHFDHGANQACLFVAGEPQQRENQHSPSPPPAVDVTTFSELSEDWENRQFQAYLFDTISGNAKVRPGNADPTDSILDQLTRSVGASDYFDAYCISRGLAPDAVIGLAKRFLKDTKESYFTSLPLHVASTNNKFLTPSDIQNALSNSLKRNAEIYPHARTVTALNTAITQLGFNDFIDISRNSTVGLTVNIARIGKRKADLFLDRASGLESYRGALHALGHSVFTIVSTDSVDDLGVNIAATEAIAFQAQHIALDESDPEQASFLRFLHLYQGRLYALRVIHEKSRHMHRDSALHEISVLGEEHLGVYDLPPLRLRPKLVSVDFLLAFADFFERGEIPHRWTAMMDLSSSLTNRHLVTKFQLLEPTLIDMPVEIR